MIVNKTTRNALAYRRFARKALKDGYEEIAENGHPLWRFRRGFRTQERIIDARVDPTGYSVWIKAARP